MNVSLTPELEKFVHEKVKSGAYASASEVVREALRERQEREAQFAEFKREVNEKIEHSIRCLEAGNFIEGTIDELRRSVLEQAHREAGLDVDAA